MSVTITIEDNHKHIDQHTPELIEVDEEIGYKDYPFELQLANGNFYSFFNALSVPSFECCGTISAIELLSMLDSFKVNSLVSESYQEGNLLYCGRDIQKCTRYYWELRKIVIEAIRRGKDVLWS